MRVSLSPLLQRAMVGLFFGRFVFAELFELGHVAVAFHPRRAFGVLAMVFDAFGAFSEQDFTFPIVDGLDSPRTRARYS